MDIKNPMSSERFYEAFAYLQEQKDSLKICTKDGFVSIGSKELLRFSCPLVNSIFKDIPCCNSNLAVISLPDVSTTSTTKFLKIILDGISSSDMSLSTNQLKEVEEIAMMFGLEMTNIEYVHKSKADKDLHFAKAKIDETPAANLQVESRENSLILQIKTEPSFEVDNEALMKADPPKTADYDLIKEETLDLNVETKAKEYPTQDNSAVKTKIYVTPIPTPTPSPTPTMFSSFSSKSPRSPKTEKYLHKVRSTSSRGSKRSISEETMAALAEMMKDPKRKPTMDEMEELLNRAKSFKASSVRNDMEKKRDSPRSPERRSDRSRSKRRSDSRNRRQSRGRDKRSVSRERRSSSHVSVPSRPSPAAQEAPLQFIQAHPGPGQYQNHPQIAQPGQVQYVVQQGGALQAIVPGTVPMQYTVQGMEHMQYNMVPVPASNTLQIRSPSPAPWSRRSPDESQYLEGVRKSERSMAQKKASLLNMTVEEKRRMTCLDWNSGLCPRLDSGKLCVFGGSKKKHICSKIIKATSKLGGSKVCWGKHREGEHKERLESRDGGYRDDLKVRDYRR